MSTTLQDLAVSPLSETLQKALGSLLHPVSSDSPAGSSLRYDALYDRVRAARHTESDTLPQGVWQRDLPQADWVAVDQLTTDALETRSKDLQLAIWRTEALLHLQGLPGLAGGCQLILGLHCLFAQSMHPAPESLASDLPLNEDDPGVEGRLNLVQWLNDKLAVQLKFLPITAPNELAGVPAFTFADMEAARLQDQHRSSCKPTESRLKLFEQSLTLTSSTWLGERWNELQHTTEMIFVLEDVLDAVYGQANGGLLKIKKVLEEMHTIALAALPKGDCLPVAAIAVSPASMPETAHRPSLLAGASRKIWASRT